MFSFQWSCIVRIVSVSLQQTAKNHPFCRDVPLPLTLHHAPPYPLPPENDLVSTAHTGIHLSSSSLLHVLPRPLVSAQAQPSATQTCSETRPTGKNSFRPLSSLLGKTKYGIRPPM